MRTYKLMECKPIKYYWLCCVIHAEKYVCQIT